MKSLQSEIEILSSFKAEHIPELEFGAGRLDNLPDIASRFGKNVLLLTGDRSFRASDRYTILKKLFFQAGFQLFEGSCKNEPNADLVNETVNIFKNKKIECVIAIGGGSVIDFGKAVSAMLTTNSPIEAFLEKIGHPENCPGTKIPFIAIPTTAGTGSEATKNAVITVSRPAKIKVSLRHNNFIPDIALIDPSLHLTLPPTVTAACGMDALTQLIEPYTSKAATPMTDTLALEGIQLIGENILGVCSTQAKDVDARGAMALATFFSGICLANAGLGLVHGFAGIIGGQFSIPHGIICATLLPKVTEATVIKARTGNINNEALKRYAAIGRTISGKYDLSDTSACDTLIQTLCLWKTKLKIPGLSPFGITPESLEILAGKADNKNALICLDFNERKNILMTAR